MGQVIGDRPKTLAGQVSINVQGRLFRGQVRAYRVRRKNLCRLAEDFGPQVEERGVGGRSAFDPPPARFTLTKVIGHG
jgi:hypothetical protein